MSTFALGGKLLSQQIVYFTLQDDERVSQKMYVALILQDLINEVRARPIEDTIAILLVGKHWVCCIMALTAALVFCVFLLKLILP